MSLMIYNTLTRRKEPFEPLEGNLVKMYVCGPTVYDKAHVGHAMSSVVFDVIRRYLEYRGYQVTHVMNYTDVEDKVIERAKILDMDPISLAEGYLQEYEEHLQELNILHPTVTPRASHEIGPIIEMVQGLIEAGFAYEIEGDVYFQVSHADGYGKLSGRRLEDMRAGARLQVDVRKEDPADFALWKAAKPGEPSWESPWGKGRPGWHIECSAMILHHLGEQIDIHGGGTDLIFPHHENEIAQSESLTGEPFVRYWVHNGLLQLAGEKMSKSLGNLVTVEEFLANHGADVFRMLVLNANYRSPLMYSENIVSQAENALGRLRGALRVAPDPDAASKAAEETLMSEVEAAQRGFEAAMDDDFNTAGALSQLFGLVRAIHQAHEAEAGKEAIQQAQARLGHLGGVLGLRLEQKRASHHLVDPLIDLLVEVRGELRASQQWDLSDTIRDRLVELGVILEDGIDGTNWHLG